MFPSGLSSNSVVYREKKKKSDEPRRAKLKRVFPPHRTATSTDVRKKKPFPQPPFLKRKNISYKLPLFRKTPLKRKKEIELLRWPKAISVT
jgi:hypothetical protein